MQASPPANPSSPITGKPTVRLVSEVATSELIRTYRQKFRLDVTRHFAGLDQVRLYECEETGYRFYEPSTTAGDADFYAWMGELPWYYSPWKWEHARCAELVSPGSSVLEIGAAKGHFLEKLAALTGATCVGLELNPRGSAEAQRRGIDVREEFVQDHARTHGAAYDVVCSFQVIEHVPAVRSFLEGAIACIKPGGRLVLSMPNEDSFIGELANAAAVLNMPPHHVGRWGERALRSLEKHFPLRCERILTEPLSDDQVFNYIHHRLHQMTGRRLALTNALWRLRAYKLLERYVRARTASITGHTIMAVYVVDDGRRKVGASSTKD